MSNFWWLEPEWKETRCSQCGRKIWPEGDPDHGVCYDCYMERDRVRREEKEYYDRLAREEQEYFESLREKTE